MKGCTPRREPAENMLPKSNAMTPTLPTPAFKSSWAAALSKTPKIIKEKLVGFMML